MLPVLALIALVVLGVVLMLGRARANGRDDDDDNDGPGGTRRVPIRIRTTPRGKP